MRTSTLLAVLAALMLLVACAAPVFGQSSSSSSSSTGAASSSSSSATIIASSSSSTGTSTNNNTAASSSSSTGTNNGGTSIVLLSFNSTFQNTDANQATYTAALKSEIARALGVNPDFVQIQAGSDKWVTINGNTYVLASIVGVSNAVTLLNNIKSSSSASSYPYLQQATIQSADQFPTGAASTLSFGFAAVAVVLAALLL